jgi:hypothetical protein
LASFLHPVARILLWCGWAVAVERAAPPLLLPMAVASATAFLFPGVRAHAWRLLRRTRWLLLVLVLTYAYVVPGTALWPPLGWVSPSIEGLQQGALRAARLALMLAGLAVLFASTARPRLLFALYVLARPLGVLGFDRRAFAVRLALTLDYAERMPKPARWLDALRAPPADDAPPATLTLEAERWQSRDTAVILSALFLVGILLA